MRLRLLVFEIQLALQSFQQMIEADLVIALLLPVDLLIVPQAEPWYQMFVCRGRRLNYRQPWLLLQMYQIFRRCQLSRQLLFPSQAIVPVIP